MGWPATLARWLPRMLLLATAACGAATMHAPAQPSGPVPYAISGFGTAQGAPAGATSDPGARVGTTDAKVNQIGCVDLAMVRAPQPSGTDDVGAAPVPVAWAPVASASKHTGSTHKYLTAPTRAPAIRAGLRLADLAVQRT